MKETALTFSDIYDISRIIEYLSIDKDRGQRYIIISTKIRHKEQIEAWQSGTLIAGIIISCKYLLSF